MIKNLQPYLFSLYNSFEKLITDINSCEKRIRPKYGLRFVEPSRTEISTAINRATKLENIFKSLHDNAFETFVLDNDEVKISIKANTYANSLTQNQLNQLIWTKRNTVADGIHATLACLELGLLLPSLIELRSTLEQISSLMIVEKQCVEVFNDRSLVMEDFELINELSSIIHKNTLATRIDWEHYIENPIQGGKTKNYKPSEKFESIQADSILRSIDYLDKQLKGSRRAYEFLCEFAHPNAGAYLAFRSRKKEVKNKSPFAFIETVLSNETPSDSIDWLKKPIIECYLILYDSLMLFENSSDSLNNISKKINKKTNELIKQLVKNYAPIWQHSEPCPCLSGENLSSCCGKFLKKQKHYH